MSQPFLLPALSLPLGPAVVSLQGDADRRLERRTESRMSQRRRYTKPIIQKRDTLATITAVMVKVS